MVSHKDLSYATNLQGALERASRRSEWLTLLIICGLVATTLAWARTAVIEEVTTGVGKVVPAQLMQVVQSLEGGIVRELHVHEGDRVDLEQVLMRIDDTGFSSRLGELSQRRSALVAELTRLKAEAAGKSEVAFDPTFAASAPAAVANEIAAFEARRQKLTQEVALLQQQVQQREQETAEFAAKLTKIEAQLVPLQRELSLNRKLKSSGNVAEVDILRLERALAELDGDRKITAASLPRAKAATAEAQARLAAAGATFTAQVQERLSAVQNDLSVIDESLKGAQDKVVRTAVRSPVRGIVNKLNVTTLGAVVQPGQPLAEIVPLDDSLLVEARVRPRDVAFVHTGQRATVKITAYDYLIYGLLEGKVDRISPDTIKDEKGEPFYQVIVRTVKSHLGSDLKPLPIMPGLVATVDIETSRRTVFDYIAKPVLRARYEALRER